MERELIGIISFIGLVLLLAARMPVAFVMLVLGMGGIAWIKGTEAAVSAASAIIYGTFANYALVVVPLFTWMGYLGYHSGMGSHLYEAAYKMVGRLKGGLAMATTIACAAFGAICGSTTATSATFATLALPEMKKRGYDPSLATACIAASGILGVLIPPSVIFIVYASITAESVAKLFIGGILPGLLLMVLFMGGTYTVVALDPKKAPPGPSFPWSERLIALAKGGIEVIIIFAAVIGGLLAGLFTGTEAGSVGCFATLVVVLVRRALTWKGFVDSLKDTVRTSTMVMFLVGAAAIYGEFLGITRLPMLVSDWVVALPLPPWLIIIAILFILLIMGCFVDALAMILLTTPIFYPAAMKLGYDGTWFGIIMTLALGMGVLTPPVGANVYVVFAVDKETPVMTIFKGTWPYLIALWVCCIILLAFPPIVTYLPSFIK
ncbi:MAG: C4-dicarboxylate ABC transporter permease [Deltaproteobacteria bacterium RBG_13_52_11b]|nr:MAG: C4-dicarboxylate ABC transporter permease [Deltaproteobacteria bacterium RBG_13_52_11b]